jgi:Transmembrane domain of unknown function (DUF3566)
MNRPIPARPLLWVDNLIGMPPEEDGVDHRVEPPSWLPEGAAPADTDEVAGGPGAADTAAQESGNGAHDGTAADGSAHDNGAHDYGAGSSAQAPDGTDTADAVAAGSYDAGSYEASPDDGGSTDSGYGGGSYDVSGRDGSGSTVSADYPGAAGSQSPVLDVFAVEPPASEHPGLNMFAVEPPAADYSPASVFGVESPAPEPAPADPFGTDTGSAGHEPADPLTYGQDGSYVYEQPSHYEYRQHSAYGTSYLAESGYDDGVSQPEAGEPQVPPYPAELPSQSATAGAATATKSGLAGAAYRALPKPRVKSQPGKSARRANLVIARFEPWSVMKFSFLMSLVAWVVLFVAVAIVYYALSGLGVFAAIQRTLQSVTSSQQSAGVSLSQWMSASRVLGYTMLIGALNIVVITALSTVGAMIYNLVTHLGGGVEVTLKETD